MMPDGYTQKEWLQQEINMGPGWGDPIKGPTAMELSKSTGIPLTGKWGGIYRILGEMEREGLIESDNCRPRHYMSGPVHFRDRN